MIIPIPGGGGLILASSYPGPGRVKRLTQKYLSFGILMLLIFYNSQLSLRNRVLNVHLMELGLP